MGVGNMCKANARQNIRHKNKYERQKYRTALNKEKRLKRQKEIRRIKLQNIRERGAIE